MIGAIRKDFILVRKQFLALSIMALILTLPLLLSVFVSKSAPGISMEAKLEGASEVAGRCAVLCTVLAFAVTGSLQSILIQADIRRKNSLYFMSSPASVQGLVASKYYEVFLLSFGAFLYCMIVELIASVLAGTLLSYTILYLAVFFLQMLGCAINIPLITFFGPRVGGHARTVLLLILGLGALVYGLFGDISFFLSENGLNHKINTLMAHANNEDLLEKVLDLAMPYLVLLLLIPHLIVFFVYLSYRISCGVYRKGVENLEA